MRAKILLLALFIIFGATVNAQECKAGAKAAVKEAGAKAAVREAGPKAAVKEAGPKAATGMGAKK